MCGVVNQQVQPQISFGKKNSVFVGVTYGLCGGGKTDEGLQTGIVVTEQGAGLLLIFLTLAGARKKIGIRCGAPGELWATGARPTDVSWGNYAAGRGGATHLKGRGLSAKKGGRLEGGKGGGEKGAGCTRSGGDLEGCDLICGRGFLSACDARGENRMVVGKGRGGKRGIGASRKKEPAEQCVSELGKKWIRDPIQNGQDEIDGGRSRQFLAPQGEKKPHTKGREVEGQDERRGGRDRKSGRKILIQGFQH